MLWLCDINSRQLGQEKGLVGYFCAINRHAETSLSLPIRYSEPTVSGIYYVWFLPSMVKIIIFLKNQKEFSKATILNSWTH
jgi:hypothetical protein